MKQTLINIRWPEGKGCYVPHFREQLAKTNELPSEFFHYGHDILAYERTQEVSNDGKIRIIRGERVTKHFDNPVPLIGRPPVRIIGGKTWVGIVADPGKQDLMMPYVGTFLKVANRIAQVPVKIEIEEREFGITLTDYPVKYMLREMSIFRRSESAKAKDTALLASERIFGGVSSDNHFGIDGITAQFGMTTVSTQELDIKVFPLKERGMPLRSADGLSKEYLSLVDAEVYMNANLDGMWQVGNLTARGYGRLIKAIKIRSQK